MKINPIIYIKSFGIKLFVLKLIKKVFGGNASKWSSWIDNQIEEVITDYLIENIDLNPDVYRKIRNYGAKKTSDIPKVIWIMWWQGKKNAPTIVKMCISQIYRLNEQCDIRVLDKENYSNYVVIPKNILVAVEKGKMSFANLADIIRCQVLERWGGVWMDATLFITVPLDDSIFKRAFYSTTAKTSHIFPSHGRWDTFFMASPPYAPLFLFVNAFLKCYFDKFDFVLDYYLIDYVIKIAYKMIPEVKSCIDSIPVNNVLCHSLLPLLDRDSSRGKIYLEGNTEIFKLTWKGNFAEQINGVETTYGYLLKKYFNEYKDYDNE